VSAGAKPPGHLVAVEIDTGSIAAGPDYIGQERAAAIRDLIAENQFAPEGREGEQFRLRLSVVERRLCWRSPTRTTRRWSATSCRSPRSAGW
jgi:uncharacterized protein (UPF0262 family)